MSDTKNQVANELRHIASLKGHPGYTLLLDWMEREYKKCINEMMDERKREDNLKTLAREAKTYKKIIQKVDSAFEQLKNNKL